MTTKLYVITALAVVFTLKIAAQNAFHNADYLLKQKDYVPKLYAELNQKTTALVAENKTKRAQLDKHKSHQIRLIDSSEQSDFARIDAIKKQKPTTPDSLQKREIARNYAEKRQKIIEQDSIQRRQFDDLDDDQQHDIAELANLTRFLNDPFDPSLSLPDSLNIKSLIARMETLKQRLNGTMTAERDIGGITSYDTRGISGASVAALPTTSLLSATTIIDGTA